MSRKKGKMKARAEPKNKRSMISCIGLNDWDSILCSGYIPLSKNPEVMSCVNKIADLISSITIHLMENTDEGDVRLKDELARKVDIYPNDYMTRKTFISVIVRNLLLEGDGNSVVYPETKNGYLSNLIPMHPSSISFIPKGFGYEILINGKSYDPSDLIHIVVNPSGDYPWKGNGYRVSLNDLVKTLTQASATTRAFMASKWKPSVIVKVDGMTDEFSTSSGRRKLLQKYVESSEAGEPWLLPADGFDVEVVKPLSLTDIAINESITLNKRTVAAILDVPPFVLGIGEFKEAEWNNFINTRIRNICNAIEQELSKKLLISPTRYFRFNNRSLFAYDLEKLSRVGKDCYTCGIMTGNEVRDWINLSPKEGLDELIILENYIPQQMIGDQKKLIQTGGDGDE